MKKIALLVVSSFVSLASCAHEMTAHKDVAEEKLVFAPDPPADDAGSDENVHDAAPITYPGVGTYEMTVAASIADGTKQPDPPNVFANGHRAVLSDTTIPHFWQVPMDLAKSADALLEPYLRQKKPKVADRLPHYDAQIWGESYGGRKLIVFYLMSRDAIRIGDDGSQNTDDWMTHHGADVRDGFDDFFRIYFDAGCGCFLEN